MAMPTAPGGRRCPQSARGRPHGAPSVFQGTAAVMLTLASKLKRDDGLKGSRASATASDPTRRVSVRDRLLVKGEAAPPGVGGSVGAGSSLWRVQAPVG